jgi:hypothetical protein
MKKIKNTFRVVVFVLLLGGWLLAASALHIVRTGNKAVIIPKNRIGIRETYVNTTTWAADDVANHPTLAKRLVDTGHTEVLAAAFKEVPASQLSEKIDQAIARGPTTKPSDVIGDKVDQLAAQADQAMQKAGDAVSRAKESVSR